MRGLESGVAKSNQIYLLGQGMCFQICPSCNPIRQSYGSTGKVYSMKDCNLVLICLSREHCFLARTQVISMKNETVIHTKVFVKNMKTESRFQRCGWCRYGIDCTGSQSHGSANNLPITFPAYCNLGDKASMGNVLLCLCGLILCKRISRNQ